jgi:large subunit ribosomal protein L30
MPAILKITLVKSMIGRPEKHRRVLRGMGLTKLNKTVELKDTPEIRGMINTVSHLVRAEEKTDETQ